MLLPQDLVVSVLFPYLLPSLPVKKDSFPPNQFRPFLEGLLMLFCNVDLEKRRRLLETFVRQTFGMLCLSTNLDKDLCFLADMEKRSSFQQKDIWVSDLYSRYACLVLIQHRVDCCRNNNHAL